MSDLVRPNGAGVMALLAADLLTASGHDVLVVGGAMSAELERSLSSVHESARAFTHDERALDGSVTATDHLAFLRSFSAWFNAELDSWAPDVVYVHNCGRILGQLDLADLSCRHPVVHTMHDEWFITDAHYTFRSGSEGPVVRTFEPGRSEHVLEHRYDHLFEIPERVGRFVLVAPSRWLADRASRVFPTLDVRHVPNAVDTDLFDLQERTTARRSLGLPKDREIVLFVGSPTQERKGFVTFANAMRHAAAGDKGPIQLVVGGSESVISDGLSSSLAPGPILSNLERQSLAPPGRLGMGEDSIVVGGIDRELMPALYGAADLLVHPSIIDNLPTVPIEAGLCGTRCLATDVGGTAQTIAASADLIDPDISPEGFGALIRDALDASLTENLSDRQMRRDIQLARFSIETHRQLLLPVLDEVTARSSSE